MNASTAVVEESIAKVGAEIMGRGKFGGGPGPWGEAPWRGWWGEEPPFHMPVFVLTHHEREPLTLANTTFTFVTDGIEAALERAKEAAAGKDVAVGGGAEVVDQYPLRGSSTISSCTSRRCSWAAVRGFFDGVGPGVTLEQVRVVEAPGVTHLAYRVA